MIRIIILILALSIDSLSFGIAQGFSKNRISFVCAIIMSIISTILFALPIYISEFIFKYLDENICNIINGIVLICLGAYYLISYFRATNKAKENAPNITAPQKNKLTIGYCILCTFPISLDTIFTGFLTGYSLSYIIEGLIIYFFVTFSFIYIGNRVSLKLTNKLNLNFEWLSGIIFIILGILKFFGK